MTVALFDPPPSDTPNINISSQDPLQIIQRTIHIMNHPFQGIFCQMQQSLNGRSANESQEITITASSIEVGNVNNLTLPTGQDFYTKNALGSWIQFDLKHKYIIYGYALKSRPYAHDDTAHKSIMRQWSLLGSNTAEENDWKLLDARPPNNDMLGYLVEKGYVLDKESPPYRYFKLVNDGRNFSTNSYHLLLSQIEFHGYKVDE